MKKIFLLVLTFLLILPISFSAPYLKCERKGSTWECRYYGSKCEITQNEIKCEIFETPFGSERKKLYIFGTEYEVGDEGRVFLQVLDGQQPVNNAICLLDLYYPNKTIWFNDASMKYLEGSDGLYYFDLIIPEKTGIYMLTVKCLYVINYTKDYVDSFTLEVGKIVSGDYTETWREDFISHVIKENPSLRFYYQFFNVSVPSNYSGMEIRWIGKWNSPEERVFMYIWNFCLNNWTIMPNSISTNTPMVMQFLPKEEWNISCYLVNGTVRIGFMDEDPNEKIFAGSLSTDLLEVRMNFLSFGAIEIIRGGGELHVAERGEYMAEKTWEEFFIRGTPALMESTQYTCIDNQTLLKNVTFEFCKNEACRTYSKVEEIKCEWGCDSVTQSCAPNPFYKWLIVVGIMGIIFLTIILIWRRGVYY